MAGHQRAHRRVPARGKGWDEQQDREGKPPMEMESRRWRRRNVRAQRDVRGVPLRQRHSGLAEGSKSVLGDGEWFKSA